MGKSILTIIFVLLPVISEAGWPRIELQAALADTRIDGRFEIDDRKYDITAVSFDSIAFIPNQGT